jgi:hypothetical protein
VPEVAEQVHDRGRTDDTGVAQWEVANRARELLELAGGAGALAGVIRVVRARCELVHEEVAGGGEEQLHRDHAMQADRFGDSTSDVSCSRQERRRKRGRDDGPRQDLSLVVIERRREHGQIAVRAARDHDRKLAGEVERALGDAGPLTELRPDCGRIRSPRCADLAASIVAAAIGLYERIAEFRECRRDVAGCVHLAVGTQGKPVPCQPPLLDRAILDDSDDP